MATAFLTMTSATKFYHIAQITLMSQVFEQSLVNRAKFGEQSLSAREDLITKDLNRKLDFYKSDWVQTQ